MSPDDPSIDWRYGPPPQPCRHCQATLAACEAKRMLSGRRCCQRCSDGAHPIREANAA